MTLAQGMNFQARTSTFHRTRKQCGGSTRVKKQKKQKKQKTQQKTQTQRKTKQKGGAAEYPSAFDAILPSNMTGVMASGGSATHRLDVMLQETSRLASQVGGAKRSSRKVRKASRKSKKILKKRKSTKQKGGSHHLNFSPTGVYDLGVDPAKGGLHKQWFDENQVIPNFGGHITVPGGK